MRISLLDSLPPFLGRWLNCEYEQLEKEKVRRNPILKKKSVKLKLDK